MWTRGRDILEGKSHYLVMVMSKKEGVWGH